MTFNARSLCNKTVGVTKFLKEHGCDICFITEAWLKVKDASTDAEIKSLGYNVTFQPRKGRRGGGVCALFKSHVDLKKCNIVKFKTVEVMETSIKSKTNLLRTATFYRTGKMSSEGRSNFAKELDEYLSSFVAKKGEKLHCGDFNIHVQNPNDNDRAALYSVTESYGFIQLINYPTHRDGATLDLIFVQNESNIKPSIEQSLQIHDLAFPLTTDHCFIECDVPFAADNQESRNIKFSYREFQKVDVEAFCNDTIEILSEITNDFFTEEINTAASIFDTALLTAIDKHAPTIDANVKPKRTCFTNSQITFNSPTLSKS